MIIFEIVSVIGFAYLGYTLGKHIQKLEDWWLDNC